MQRERLAMRPTSFPVTLSSYPLMPMLANRTITFVPIAEAAQLLETTEMRVLMMLKKNELRGKMEYFGGIDISI